MHRADKRPRASSGKGKRNEVVSSKRAVAAVLITAIFVIFLLNILYAIIRAPEVGETAYMIRHHKWHHSTRCGDSSVSCATWVEKGGCKWDRLTQMLCKDSCNRCGDNFNKQPSDVGVPMGLASLPGFANLSQTSQQKRHQALVAPHMLEVGQKITQLNHKRLSVARMNPLTCQHSPSHPAGLTLTHAFNAFKSNRGSQGSGQVIQSSIQNTCRFELLPHKTPIPEECFDGRKKGSCKLSAECFAADFATMQRACTRTCGYCGGCTDKQAQCNAWADAGRCYREPTRMLELCPEACSFCGAMFDPQPPHWAALWNGLLMPTVGLGTAGLGDKTEAAVRSALRVGYRAIDTAQAPEWYREGLVGAAVQKSGIAREEIFITTKIHPRHLGYQAALRAFESSLRNFATDFIDLVLLHYAECWGTLCDRKPEGDWKESWRALEELVVSGKVLAIGVSNFSLEQIIELLEWAVVPPSVVQRRSDLFTQDRAVQRLCLTQGIRYTAYSTLGTQYWGKQHPVNPVLNNEGVKAIAHKHGLSPAQCSSLCQITRFRSMQRQTWDASGSIWSPALIDVAVKFALGSGQMVIPRSSSESHLREFLPEALQDVHFSSADLLLLRSLDGQLQYALPESVPE